MREFAGQRLNLDDEAGGESGPYARREAEPPGQAIGDKANRLCHLLTIWRGVSSLAAIRSLGNPSSARRMILAWITSQYDDVYCRAIDSSDSRSSLERRMSYGLFLGIEGRRAFDARLAGYVTELTTKYVTIFSAGS